MNRREDRPIGVNGPGRLVDQLCEDQWSILVVSIFSTRCEARLLYKRSSVRMEREEKVDFGGWEHEQTI